MNQSSGAVVTAELRDQFAADGVVKVEGALDAAWIDRLLAVADQQLDTPGDWVTDTNPGAVTDRLFTTRYLWPHNDIVRGAALDSGIAPLVGELLDTSSLRFYFDHTLIKEPQTTAPTPWHQDIPYWPFQGRKIASAWVALTETTVAQSGLEFIRGSHRWNAYYAPESFTPQTDGSTADWTSDFEGDRIPDIEAARSDYDIVSFDVRPGDAIVFSAWTIHGAPGNAGDTRRVAFSTRWLGDDTTWDPHPGSDPTVSQDEVSIEPGTYPGDDRHFPLAWSRD